MDDPIVISTENGIASTIFIIEMPLGPHPGTYELNLDFNTLCNAEGYMGNQNLMTVADAGIVGLRHIRALFFTAGLRQNGLMSLDAAGAVIQANPDAFTDLVAAFQSAALMMFPVKADASGN